MNKNVFGQGLCFGSARKGFGPVTFRICSLGIAVNPGLWNQPAQQVQWKII
jgi:hypothetical protein